MEWRYFDLEAQLYGEDTIPKNGAIAVPQRRRSVPDLQTQEMRDLLRTRKQLVRERRRHVQRLQKTLEDANNKLDSVISDIMGLSGRKMIEALISGERDPEQ